MAIKCRRGYGIFQQPRGGNLASDRVQRRLTAILAADVAGYSRLMGLDEAGTARTLHEHRAVVDPIVARYGGRIVKTTGDGVLLEFPSIVAAVDCAVVVQNLMRERNRDVPEERQMLFRIGINLGDVLIDGDDILGDGVNIAARLEGIAEPGGICVSDDVFRQVSGKLDVSFEDIGNQQLKNIARPVHTYRARIVDVPASRTSASILPLPDKPSIAVLPFTNMGGDPEQEYFADGMVEEIITALSHFRQLFVIARNSSFTYKGRAVDVKQVGRELGVRYVLEGSVRKATNRVRITGQLVDAATGAHLWAERFDGGLGDIFDLQDQVTESVVGAIAPAVEKAEIERARRKPTESLDAYALYLRGLAAFYQFGNRQANEEALRLFNSAIELDPDFASAYSRAAYCYPWAKSEGWISVTGNEIAEVTRLAQRAVELGKDDAMALATSGWALAFVVRDLDVGAALVDRALVLNSNLAEAWFCGGWVKNWLGEPKLAIERFARAMRLSPLDPLAIGMRSGTAHAHFFLGRYDEAASWAAMALQENPDHQPGLRIAAASNAMAGRPEQARRAVARLRQLNPALRVSNLKDVLGPYGHANLSRYEEGLRRAGLPE
jgi:TolB-like protein